MLAERWVIRNLFCRGTAWVTSKHSSMRRQIGIATSRQSSCWVLSEICRGNRRISLFKIKSVFRILLTPR